MSGTSFLDMIAAASLSNFSLSITWLYFTLPPLLLKRVISTLLSCPSWGLRSYVPIQSISWSASSGISSIRSVSFTATFFTVVTAESFFEEPPQPAALHTHIKAAVRAAIFLNFIRMDPFSKKYVMVKLNNTVSCTINHT